MDMIGRLTNLETDYRMLERFNNEFYMLVKEVFSEENTMTNNFYSTKK